MRKRRKPTPAPIPEPEPSEEVAELLAEPIEPEPDPPSIYMLWCPKCHLISMHALGCDGVPIIVKYEVEGLQKVKED